MELPTLPVPAANFIHYISSSEKPIREAIEPYRAYENSLRSIYAQEPDHEAAQDPHVNLVPVFAGQEGKLTIHPRDLSSEPRGLQDKFLLALATADRKLAQSPAITRSLKTFRDNFNVFSESSLVDLDWNNVVVAGSSAATALLPVAAPHNESKRALREYYHQTLAPASDVDLFLYGLTEDQAIEKIKQIETSIRDSILYETTVVRTKYAITIASQYPCRHVQIVLRIYKNISEILTGFDVDSSCVAYDGSQVYATPRAIAAYMTQTNVIDLSRRSPSYENRLFKYARRGFEVYCPTVDRSRIDPTIFERSFGRVLGLARLLVLEKLPGVEDRGRYLAKRRQERGRPPLSSQQAAAWTQFSPDIKERHPEDVAEWVEQDEVSNYHTCTVPYGPKFHAKKIEKLLFTKDLLLNAEWNKPKDRKVDLHRHPAFFGRVADVIEDCCGFCPEPTNEDEALVAEEEAERYLKGRITFITHNPGRQQIGSFHPLTDDDWTDMAYVGNTPRLCQAIVDRDLEHVQDWCTQADADVNRRDHAGRTPLHLAATCSTPDIVKCLIDHGARLVARLVDGQTALHIAARRGDTAIIKLLLEKSEENGVKEDEKLDRRRAAMRARNTTANLLEEAESADDEDGFESDGDEDEDEDEDEDDSNDEDDITEGSFVRVKKQRSDAPPEIDNDADEPDVYDINVAAWDYPTSPLHMAILGGHVDAAKTLVDTFGADVLLPIVLKNEYTKEPRATILSLVLAAKYSPKSSQMTQQLLDLGATSSQADKDEFTALLYMVFDGNMNAIDILLKHDRPAAVAALQHLSVSGYQWNPTVVNALSIAIRNRNEEVALTLLDAGASTEITQASFAQAFHRKFSNAPKDPAQIEQTFNRAVDQPIILAVQNDMPKLALRMLDASNMNSLTKDGLQRLNLDQMESKFATTVLDLVRGRIKALRKDLEVEKQPIAEPQPLRRDDHYLEGLPLGSYRHWLAVGDLHRAKLVSKQLDVQHKIKAEISPERGAIEKKAAIQSVLKDYLALEQQLLKLGAQTFTILHPTIKVIASSDNSHHQRYFNNIHNQIVLYDTYETRRTFMVPDIDDDKAVGYVALFEAAFAGDTDMVKALTLAPWRPCDVDAGAGSTTEIPPLKIAVQDGGRFSPYSLAVLRGHYVLAKLILDITMIQHNPADKDSKYRYALRSFQEGGMDSDSDYDDSDIEDSDEARNNIRVYSQLVDDNFTIDDIAALGQSVDSKVSPQNIADWQCETWRNLGPALAFEVGIAMPSEEPSIDPSRWYPPLPAEKHYTQAHLCRVLHEERFGQSSSLLDYAIAKNDLALVKFLIGIGNDLIKRKPEQDSDSSRIYRIEDSSFDYAARLGRTDILSELLRTTGTLLPLDRMVEKAGVEIKDKPRYYQGLTVYGSKRKDWADQSRGIMPHKAVENDTPPLLRAAYTNNAESTAFFLSDGPQLCYDTFLETNKNDFAIKALNQEEGGAQKSIKSWLGNRSSLVAHAAVLAAPNKADPLKLLRYVLQAMPNSLEAKNCSSLTPLHLAFRYGRYAAARYLIAQGADQAARDRSGENVLHHYIRDMFSLDLDSKADAALRAFMSLLDPSLPAELLTQRSRSDAGSYTPLALLLLHKKTFDAAEVERVRILLSYSKGKDLVVMNGAGDYPLHTAVRSCCTLLVKLFLELDPSLVHRENAVGMTPLEIAMVAVDYTWANDQDFQYRVSRAGYSTRPITNEAAALFVPKVEDPDEPSKENVLKTCMDVSRRNPGKRKLVSLLDANEVAKRLATVESRAKQQNHHARYPGGYSTSQQKKEEDDEVKDEVTGWMAEANKHKKWDSIQHLEEQEVGEVQHGEAKQSEVMPERKR
ncbi:hypothetical protein ANO11243_009570 [Dothideomycetidae sp. 11243]|nr:hypothetical protein ANO11243_009570 [fungal sp. No.11243]